MIKYIKRFFFLCEHNWIIKEKIHVVEYWSGEQHNVGTKYVLQCEKCGNMKVKRV